MIVEPVFVHFGRAHLLTLAVIVGVGLALPLWARGQRPGPRHRIAFAMALAMVTYRTGYIPIVAWLYEQPVRNLLPLHVCAILQYICAYTLWKRDQRAYEVAYFWGMGGTFQALLTPDLVHGYPHPGYFSYFVPHGALLVAISYATLALGLRPVPTSILRALGATLVYALLLLPINVLLGTNYMYLLAKPASASLLDHLGPWPWYILAAIGVAAVSYVFWYLPFWIADTARGQRRVAA